MALPLVVTTDEELLDDLVRLAAAAGTELDVAPDLIAARDPYRRAPLVLIGADQTDALTRARLPRRDAVVLVGRPHPDDPPPALLERLGIAHVATLPGAEQWLLRRLAAPVRPVARVITVLGGHGGAGASTVAGALAVTAATHGRRALLVDADPLSGGPETLLDWGRLAARPGGELHVVSAGPPHHDGIPAAAMTAVLDATRYGRDLVVVDLPRYLDAATVTALERADQSYLVVTAGSRPCAAARRVVETAGRHCRRLAAIVRGPAGVARRIGLPLAGALPAEVEAKTADGRGPLADLCRRLLADPPFRITEEAAA